MSRIYNEMSHLVIGAYRKVTAGKEGQTSFTRPRRPVHSGCQYRSNTSSKSRCWKARQPSQSGSCGSNTMGGKEALHRFGDVSRDTGTVWTSAVMSSYTLPIRYCVVFSGAIAPDGRRSWRVVEGLTSRVDWASRFSFFPMSPRNLASLASCGLLCSRPRYFRMVLSPPARYRFKASSSFVKTRGSFHLSFDPGFMVLRRQSDLMYFDLVSIASIHISDQKSTGGEKMSTADEWLGAFCWSSGETVKIAVGVKCNKKL